MALLAVSLCPPLPPLLPVPGTRYGGVSVPARCLILAQHKVGQTQPRHVLCDWLGLCTHTQPPHLPPQHPVAECQPWPSALYATENHSFALLITPNPRG
jgi:hypothetical protein